MVKIRRNFRQFCAEGCDVLGVVVERCSEPCRRYHGRLREESKIYFSAECEKFLPDQMFNFKTNGGKTIKCSQLEKSTFPIS